MVIDESTVRDRLRPYLPRLTLEWLAYEPSSRHRAVDGSVVFVDISGFTKLSEKLARFGRVGAEEMADSINLCFAELLSIAYDGNGSLLKFGGDALLLLFTDDDPSQHPIHAARAAHGMRARLRTVGKLATTGGKVNLRMSVGVHTGRFDFFLVGSSHRELLVTGPATTEVVRMEGTAEAGEIVVSQAMAGSLPPRSVGEAKGAGFFLRSAPPGQIYAAPWVLPDAVPDELLRSSLSVATREHLVEATGEPEHRQATVAFIHFDGTDEMIHEEGPERTAEELHRLVSDTQEAVDEYGVCFLGSDADADGGKLILTAGVPRALGEDEERMLLALRKIVQTERALPVRIGVNQGGVFAGDVGPAYRRTYTVMGDTVNLAARLMAKAPPGEIYASGSVLDRSATRFAITELEPFMVKGKAKPVNAWSLGQPVGSRAREGASLDHPLVGFEDELRTLRGALDHALSGRVQLVELVGESGVGKSRLVAELVGSVGDVTTFTATGEAYTQSVPYVAWRDVLRTLLGVGWEAEDEAVEARLKEVLAASDPQLLPWAPLIARAADAVVPLTPEVQALAPDFVRSKLHDSVHRFLRATRVDPTIFVFEDGHLMDEPSAALLSAVATSEPDDRPWLFVVVRRKVGTGFVAAEGPNVRQLEPSPLDPSSARVLAEAATEDSPLPAHLLEQAIDRAEGNPQLLLDLVVTAGTGQALPETVEAAATVRLDALPSGERTLLRRASVLGLAFHPRFLVDVLDEGTPPPDETTWRRLDEFLEEEGGGYLRFRRSVVREAAYAGLAFKIRRRLHGAVGSRMERELPEPENEAGILSLHFFLAGDHSKAWHYAMSAGRRASEIFANVEAARFFRRATEAGRKAGATDSELLEATEASGDALWLASQYADARHAYAAARRLCRDEPLLQARLMRKIAQTEQAAGKMSLSLRWLGRARAQVLDGSDHEATRMVLEIDAFTAEILASQGRHREAVKVAHRALQEGLSHRAPEAMGEAENALGAAMASLGRPGAVEHWERALQYFKEAGNLPKQAMVLLNLGVGAHFEGEWAKAVELYRRARETSERLGDTSGVAFADTGMGEIALEQGALDEANRYLQSSIRTFRASHDDFMVAYCRNQLARILAMRGLESGARELLEQAREAYLFVGARAQTLDVDAREAECDLLIGDATGAIRRVNELLQRIQREGGASALIPLLERLRGCALLQLGDLAGARSALERSVAAARSAEAAHEIALSLQALARVLRRSGEDPTDIQRDVMERFARLRILAVAAYPPKAATSVPT